MATFTRQQPAWQAPQWPDRRPPLPPLKIWNSLTRSKDLFVPIEWEAKRVSWYACGPTVYDDSHLGHARNYVTTDIIRRILKDYFQFNVHFVMNVTDVDDKIILRGRQQHLLAQFVAKERSQDDLLKTTHDALNAYLSKNLPLVQPRAPLANITKNIDDSYKAVLLGKSLDGIGPAGDKEAKIKMHIRTVQTAISAIGQMTFNEISLSDYYAETQDVLLPFLDSLHGLTIDAEDHTIFTTLTRKFEDQFTEDMRALNCLDPDEVTRVTEYVPQIVDFVKRIQDNGFAYTTSDGSVYFNIEAFEAAQNHYARLEPWNRNDTELQADGEGSLTKKTSEKKSDADFALWKSSKPGEPSWPSPWGKGRPGWHIECSAMASDKLGSRMDIHSGGIDLAFPHHDNELAQSEAFWLDRSHTHEHQWVNYFMHMGHLHIQGSKMSKSLKNFTTIKAALSGGEWTPRGLRIVFLRGGWREGIEITDDTMKAGSAWEDKVNNFFINVRDMLGEDSETFDAEGRAIYKAGSSKAQHNEETSASSGSTFNSALPQASSRNPESQEMHQVLGKAKKETYDALCDSFNTPLVMAAISELISTFNTIPDKSQLAADIVKNAGQFVTSTVNVLGLNGNTSPQEGAVGWSGISIPDAAKPYIYPVARLRDELRQKARSTEGLKPEDLDLATTASLSGEKSGTDGADLYAKIADKFSRDVDALKNSSNLSRDILQLCDRLRDVDLWDQGIYLEDRDDNQPALVRPVTKEQLAARKEKENKERQRHKVKEDAAKEAAEKAQQGKLSHREMFRTAEYSAWDDDGIPTKDNQGEEVTKSKRKKLAKDWDRQKKLHEKWLKTNA